MNEFELDKEYLTLNFESDEDAVKISLFYFLELVMIMGWGTLGNLKETQNGKIVYHEKKPMNKKFSESYSLYRFSFAFKVSNSMVFHLFIFSIVNYFVLIVLLLTLLLHFLV